MNDWRESILKYLMKIYSKCSFVILFIGYECFVVVLQL